MEKVVRVFLITLCVLGVTGVASAIQTSPFTPSPTISTAPFGVTYYRSGAGGTPSVDTVSWAFAWDVPVDSIGVDSASLEVRASDVDNASGGYMAEVHKVYIGSIDPANLLGQLAFVEGENANTFDLSAFLGQIDGNTTFVIDLFVPASGNTFNADHSRLVSSTLNMVYQYPDPLPPPPDPEPEPDPVVPAPGAIILCSLGAGLVGWLRRRGAM